MTATMTHRAAVKVADKINQYVTSPKEGLAYKKVVLGIEILLINISKVTIVIAIAALLGVIPQAILTIIGFNVLRRTASGIHATTSYGCVITSTILMVVIPFFTWGISLPRIATAAVFALILLAIYKYAPMDTKARPLIGAKKRAKLKRMSMVSCLILATLLIISPFGEINFMVTLGAVYATIFILPITYKLLRREVNNYEQYESKQQDC